MRKMPEARPFFGFALYDLRDEDAHHFDAVIRDETYCVCGAEAVVTALEKATEEARATLARLKAEEAAERN